MRKLIVYRDVSIMAQSLHLRTTVLPRVSQYSSSVSIILFACLSDRFADVCYKPAANVSEEDKRRRLEAFENGQNTTHDPASFLVKERLPPAEHPSYKAATERSFSKPTLSKRGREIAGIDSYEA
jgi:hypothetical protein